MRFLRLGFLCLAGFAGVAAVTPQLQRVNAMAGVQPGLWAIHALDKGEADVAPYCVADPARLLQFRHPSANCSWLVITDTPHVATVQYSCPGAGWGRTSVRVISPEKLRLDTQGIADNAPFALAAVANRLGDCSSQHASR